jgi:peptidoglycan glycosyltransferase
MNRPISGLASFTVLLLVALVVATTYWQTWASAGLADRQDNAIQRVAQFRIKRGLITTGQSVLARNVRKKADGQTLYFREYPRDRFAAHVVGYSTAGRSRAGLERSENDYLTASNANLSTLFDTTLDKLKGTTVAGNDLELTLRVKAQTVAQDAFRGVCGAAVALDPRTGALLAMASSPTYDPNDVERPEGFAKILRTKAACTPASPLLNRATQGLYPPGSTFKTVTAAAALDTGTFTPDSSFYDPGYCVQYGKKVYNAGNPDQNGPEAFGNVNLVTAFQHSINAVFCKIGQRLGAGTVLEYAKRFGFYELPPLETPASERAPSGLFQSGTRKLFDPKDPATEVDPGRLAFGQERLLVTPLQMAMVAAGIANGGVVMRPHVVSRVVSPGGKTVVRTKPEVLRRAIKPETAQALTTMMEAVVTGGTGTRAAIPGVRVAGKTGTAETNVPRVYTAWFVAFAPADDPKVAVAVVVEKVPNGFGGAVAAPIAKTIMEAILPPRSN